MTLRKKKRTLVDWILLLFTLSYSYHYARRRWDLARDPLLRYQHLRNFDKAMIHLEIDYKFLKAPDVRNFINQQTLFSKE
jgi:hypothetical protein